MERGGGTPVRTEPEPAVFRVMNGRNLLFNQRDQILLELNDVGAFIWCRLADGLTGEAVVAELVAGGLDRTTAESFFRKSIEDLARVGAVGQRTGARSNARAFVLDIVGVGIELRCRAAAIRRDLRSAFAHLESASMKPDVRLTVDQTAAGIGVQSGSLPVVSYKPDEAIPAIKAQLTECVLQLASYELALHAAALERDGGVVLIVGAPGAGKTTLCLALVAAGMGFAADDVVLLQAGGLAQGVPFPAAVKSGSWKFERCFARDLNDIPSFRRGDGQQVKYLRPGAVSTGAYPIRAVVVLDQGGDAAPLRLRALHSVDALRAIITGAFTPSQRLDGAGFSSLVDGLKSADCYTLCGGDPGEAAALIEATCR